MLSLNSSVALVKQLGLFELQLYLSSNAKKINKGKKEVKIQGIYVHKVLCKSKIVSIFLRPPSSSPQYYGPESSELHQGLSLSSQRTFQQAVCPRSHHLPHPSVSQRALV